MWVAVEVQLITLEMPQMGLQIKDTSLHMQVYQILITFNVSWSEVASLSEKKT